mmetsp:Transcript_16230/g.52878  ORF Transcript_16230/g.52878 Transcript_16230/m.52878 type:complete len:298 (-) Transcript_16230:95-988(-)
MLHPQSARGLVEQVDGRIGQAALHHVPPGVRHGRNEGRVRDMHAVVRLVLLLDAAKDGERLGGRRLRHHHRLEAAGQRGVFLDCAILVEGGGTDHSDLTARQLRLEQGGGVHRTGGLAGAHDRVDLIDEQDHLARRVSRLLKHALEALLKLAAVLGAREQCAHVKGNDPLGPHRFGNIAVDDALGETLRNRSLPYAGLADEYRVVLAPPRQHLDGAADFLGPADHDVELALTRQLGEVRPVLHQRVPLVAASAWHTVQRVHPRIPFIHAWFTATAPTAACAGLRASPCGCAKPPQVQ